MARVAGAAVPAVPGVATVEREMVVSAAEAAATAVRVVFVVVVARAAVVVTAVEAEMALASKPPHRLLL